MKKIVLAYSGGLDTSVILPWLKERYPGVKLVAFAAELGQGDELHNIEKKAYASGADEVIVRDLRKEFAEEYCFPMLRAHATYEEDYLLGTSIARAVGLHGALVVFSTTYLAVQCFNLWDAVVIDLPLVLLQPRWAFPPGTESSPSYRDPRWHLANYGKGFLVGLPFAAIVAGVDALVRSVS